MTSKVPARQPSPSRLFPLIAFSDCFEVVFLRRLLSAAVVVAVVAAVVNVAVHVVVAGVAAAVEYCSFFRSLLRSRFLRLALNRDTVTLE